MTTECSNYTPGITLFILCNSQKSPMRSTIMLIYSRVSKMISTRARPVQVKLLKTEIKMKRQ